MAAAAARPTPAWQAFEWKPGGVIAIDVTIDGAPARALIDTGFPNVTLSRAFARTHGLPLTSVGEGVSVGGSARFETTRVGAIEAGGVRIPPTAIAVVDLAALAQAGGRPIDLVIGASLLARIALQVDFDRHRLRLLPGSAAPAPGEAVALAFDAAKRRVLVQAEVGGRTLPRLMLDLGFDGALSMSPRAWAQLSAAGGRGATDIAVAGAGGIEVHGLAAVGPVRLGGIESGDMLAQIEAPGGFSDHNGWDGLIGLGLLSRYNLALDIASGVLRLAPRTSGDAPPARSTIGIQGLYLADRFQVLHVMRNSPAARAGLRDGDELSRRRRPRCARRVARRPGGPLDVVAARPTPCGDAVRRTQPHPRRGTLLLAPATPPREQLCQRERGGDEARCQRHQPVRHVIPEYAIDEEGAEREVGGAPAGVLDRRGEAVAAADRPGREEAFAAHAADEMRNGVAQQRAGDEEEEIGHRVSCGTARLACRPVSPRLHRGA